MRVKTFTCKHVHCTANYFNYGACAVTMLWYSKLSLLWYLIGFASFFSGVFFGLKLHELSFILLDSRNNATVCV